MNDGDASVLYNSSVCFYFRCFDNLEKKGKRKKDCLLCCLCACMYRDLLERNRIHLFENKCKNKKRQSIFCSLEQPFSPSSEPVSSHLELNSS